jgi:hypothetical protein
MFNNNNLNNFITGKELSIMNSKDILVILFTSLIGITVGTLASTYVSTGSIGGYGDVNLQLILGFSDQVLTEDSDIQSVSGSAFNSTGNISSYRDLEYVFDPNRKVGSWRGVGWTYAPDSVFEDKSDGAVLVKYDEGKSNVLQFVKLPSNGDLEIVMRARNPSQSIGIPGEECSSSRGFVSLIGWLGEVPVEGDIEGEKVRGSFREGKNKIFNNSYSELRMDVPAAFNGEKVIMFGGVKEEKPCAGEAANYLEIDSLHVVGNSE